MSEDDDKKDWFKQSPMHHEPPQDLNEILGSIVDSYTIMPAKHGSIGVHVRTQGGEFDIVLPPPDIIKNKRSDIEKTIRYAVKMGTIGTRREKK